MAIEQSREAGVLTIAFNRPEKKNAITVAMYGAFADALAQARDDRSVRAILVTGGPESFTAGNDLQDFMQNPPSDSSSPVFRFLHEISHVEKPMVAAVRGAAIGVGTTLLLHCDLVYAGESARFSLPFVQLGLVPEAASSLLLPALAGYQRAAEKLLLGEAFSATDARELGLVAQVLADGEVLAHARRQAEKLVALPAGALRATKRLMREGRVAEVEARMQAENQEFRSRLGSPEAREAFSAFFEKRRPDFSKFD